MAEPVVGIRKRTTSDLYRTCNVLQPPVSEEVFVSSFCKRCRNETCTRAQYGNPWVARMAKQVDYLLEHPIFSKLDTEDHRKIAEMIFEDRLQHATALEVSRERMDWEPVHFEKRLLTTNPFVSPSSEKPEGDAVKVEESSPTQEPTPTGEVPVVEAAPSPQVVDSPPPPSQPVLEPISKPISKPINTPMPSGGIMLDGSPPPATLPEEEDPWAPKKKDRIVPLGAKITI